MLNGVMLIEAKNGGCMPAQVDRVICIDRDFIKLGTLFQFNIIFN